MVYIHNEIFSPKGEQNYVIGRQMGGTGECHVKWNNAGSERQLSHFSLICAVKKINRKETINKKGKEGKGRVKEDVDMIKASYMLRVCVKRPQWNSLFCIISVH